LVNRGTETVQLTAAFKPDIDIRHS